MKPAALAAALAATVVGLMTTLPAKAQWTVFDPSNYTQNVLQAARALQQINNQIQSLQNQATMLTNMARSLQRLDYSSLSQLAGALAGIDSLMTQADGLSFNLSRLEAQWSTQYPATYAAGISSSDLAQQARQRWQDSMDAYHQTMRVQSQVVTNVSDDRSLIDDLVTQSQGAVGSLQVSQAANQLLALSAKQQMQVQELMVAQYRAEAEEQARKAQSEEAARVTTQRFLGSGTAYTPR
ncbi:P-type conjugative transfer protein TrbJ [Nitrospirillum viridazoti]|uniref:P-type conjugative transfer protein TrbJ n=1 Tax=Nitrospirillum amazonense TaxID=28077 RepID=A0A560HNW2_9PROT|nr:P-type conjugative transfer protein TrbJ [Nitrospirillum amazonense]TWB48248.1 P-type conjugative transfer protein TrbJ [Nitrospirillum amazonense]